MDVLQMQNWLFLPEPPEDLAPIRDFLRRYSHVPADEVDGHLVRIVSHWSCAVIFVRCADQFYPRARETMHGR